MYSRHVEFEYCSFSVQLYMYVVSNTRNFTNHIFSVL